MRRKASRRAVPAGIRTIWLYTCLGRQPCTIELYGVAGFATLQNETTDHENTLQLDDNAQTACPVLPISNQPIVLYFLFAVHPSTAQIAGTIIPRSFRSCSCSCVVTILTSPSVSASDGVADWFGSNDSGTEIERNILSPGSAEATMSAKYIDNKRRRRDYNCLQRNGPGGKQLSVESAQGCPVDIV